MLHTLISMALKAINIRKYIHTKGALSLLFYFSLNLALTLLNKLVLQKIKFPYLLTALHASASWLGCAVLLRRGKGTVRTQTLQPVDHVKLVLFSVLYSVNIGISNVSMHLTPLTLHQLLRAITPAVTALLLRLLTQKHYTPAAYASLALVVFGVALATTPQSRSGGKSSFPASASGVLLTLLGALLASLKSVAAAALQSDKSAQREGAIGLGMSPMELIDYISPLTLLQSFLYAWIAGEFNHLRLLLSIFSSPGFTAEEEATFGFDTSLGLFLLLNCLTALALNVASFEANRRVGALGITIAGNVKQVLIVVLDVTVGSGGPWTCGRWVGVLGTVGGSCWFVVEEGREKEKAKAKAKVLVEVKLKEKDGPRELEAGRAKG